ncbi:glycosyltransferase family 4 protein [Candidatus Pacearchaeota archaeon]|nr:glycosyltransferase family 4 protein [Candidatus Pacearchaeota archaeon]
MRILELTNFSAGGCGVFARVKAESALLKKAGHEVMIFSSDLEKGTNKRVPHHDSITNIPIQRFRARRLGGESYMSWSFQDATRAFKPEIIIAHGYRHPHTLQALKLGRKLNAKVLLVTHAPFGRDAQRSSLSRFAVSLYDRKIGRSTLKHFDRVIAITKWELPYLKALGVPREKITYIPNGIREEFLSSKKRKESNKLIYLGRIAPIKHLEVIIEALVLMKNKSVVELFGPAEEKYLHILQKRIQKAELEKDISIINKKYDSDEQIAALDSSRYFILPSLSEGMPQTLIEAMARGKICLASDVPGNSDLIKHGRNGFLFENTPEALAALLEKLQAMNQARRRQIQRAARASIQQFSWKIVIKKLEKVVQEVSVRSAQ